MKRLLPITMVCVLVLALTGCTKSNLNSYPDIRTINVNAEHTVNVTPDIVEISAGIESTALSASIAQNEMSSITNIIVGTMKDFAIEDKNIKITNINVNEVFDYTDAGRVSLGYKAQSEITVSSNIENSGNVIAALTDNGANSIRSINYVVSNEDEKYEEALAIAVNKAKEKANKMLSSLNKKVGDVVNITEQREYYYPYSAKESYTNLAASADMGSGTNIMPGEEGIVAKVDIVFEIN